MLKSPEKADELELELPALDGEDDAASDHIEADFDVSEESHGDAFDDATGEDSPYEELAADGAAEGGWLLDADTAGTLDVGPFDVSFAPEGKVLADDEPEARGGLEEFIDHHDETHVADGGEEGPLAQDEELREEDLPALDADEDGDVPDDHLFDRQVLGADDDLRWADRAWQRVAAPDGAIDAEDDSGVLAVPGDDPAHRARDEAWKRLDENGRAMAAAFVPGGTVVLALPTADLSRAQIVRIQSDGEARIIAEVEPRAQKEDDGEACTVTFIRWDPASGCLFVGGNFGVEAYKPG